MDIIVNTKSKYPVTKSVKVILLKLIKNSRWSVAFYCYIDNDWLAAGETFFPKNQVANTNKYTNSKLAF